MPEKFTRKQARILKRKAKADEKYRRARAKQQKLFDDKLKKGEGKK